jgi:hypothetical protein
MFDLTPFIEWANQVPTRTIDININKLTSPGIRIWAYDYKLEVGQTVQSVEEIDLEGVAMEEKRKKYERLKQQFEPQQELPAQPSADDEAMDDIERRIEAEKNAPELEAKKDVA